MELTHPSSVTASKALDDLVNLRLFREENQNWIEKAVITRIWIVTANTTVEDPVETLREFFDVVLQNSKVPLSASATHAAQTVSIQEFSRLCLC